MDRGAAARTWPICRGEPYPAAATVAADTAAAALLSGRPRLFLEDSMSGTPARSTAGIGTHSWTRRTGGALTTQERRKLLRPLVATHAVNAAGRMSMLLRVNSGRRVTGTPGRHPKPDSALTRAADALARHRLSPALLNHSYRTYAFATALGDLDNLDVDRDLLYAAALLHDIGLSTPAPQVDFTLASARAARDLAEQVGLSATATDTLLTAITLHHSPGVTLARGPVAYLLSAGAGLDVIGLWSWKLPPGLLAQVTSTYPRLGFKREFTAAFRTEAAHLPAGRAAFLRRYGAFDLAVKLAPFRG
jgi:hypothetical protein